MNIREYIKKNLTECNEGDIEATILASINRDEVILPGLGVLFEIVWNNCSDDIKNSIVKTIFNGTKKA